MADLNRVVIIHTLDQAIAALTIAAELQRPITLQSAPGALEYAGSLYLLNLFEQAARAVPSADATFILDSGNDAALAIGAILDGHRILRPSLAAPLFQKLADIAQNHRAQLCENPAKTLDIRHEHDLKTRLGEWLLCD